MSYLIEGFEYACLVGITILLADVLWITIEDRIDYHYSKKRGRRGNV